jgi:O-antigen/teichoic acid export membrane protein
MQARFIRNSVFSTIAGVATALGGFASMVIVARLVGVEGTGIVSYALWIVLLSVTVADLGLYATMTRYFPELAARGSDEADGLAWRLLRLAAIAAILLTALFAGMALWSTHNGRTAGREWQALPGFWALLAVLFLAQASANFAMGYLRGMQRFDRVARLAAYSIGLQLFCVALGGSIWGYMGALAGYIAGSVLPTLGLIQMARSSRGDLDAGLRSRVRRFALFAWVGAIAQTIVWTRIELLFLEHFLGASAVGLYAVALTFANLAAQGPILLTGAMLPFFSEGFGSSGDAGVRQRSEQVFASGTRIIAFLAFPCCLGLAALAPTLLPLIYGPAFAAAVPATMIVVAAAGISAAGAVGSHLIYGHDRSDVICYVNFGGVALFSVAGLIIVPHFGMEGAAWSRAAIHTSLVFAGCWFIVRRLGFPMPFADLARLLAAAAAAAFAAGAVVKLVPGPVALLPAIVLAALIYLLAVRLFGGLAEQDIRYLSAFLQKTPGASSRLAERGLNWLAPPRATAAIGS